MTGPEKTRVNNSRDKGFTVIEILVALTIFSLAVLGLAIGTLTVIRTNQTSHLNTAAINIAQAKLEEFRGMTSAAFSSLSCPSYTTPGCSDALIASGTTFNRSWQFTANSPANGVTSANVQINWSDYTSHSLVFVLSVPQ